MNSSVFKYYHFDRHPAHGSTSTCLQLTPRYKPLHPPVLTSYPRPRTCGSHPPASWPPCRWGGRASWSCSAARSGCRPASPSAACLSPWPAARWRPAREQRPWGAALTAGGPALLQLSGGAEPPPGCRAGRDRAHTLRDTGGHGQHTRSAPGSTYLLELQIHGRRHLVPARRLRAEAAPVPPPTVHAQGPRRAAWDEVLPLPGPAGSLSRWPPGAPWARRYQLGGAHTPPRWRPQLC